MEVAVVVEEEEWVVVAVAARHLQLLLAFGLSVLREELPHVLLRGWRWRRWGWR